MLYTYYLIHCMWMAEYHHLAWRSHQLWFAGLLDASIELDGQIALVLVKAGVALAYASPRLELPMWAESLDQAEQDWKAYIDVPTSVAPDPFSNLRYDRLLGIRYRDGNEERYDEELYTRADYEADLANAAYFDEEARLEAQAQAHLESASWYNSLPVRSF